MILNLDLDQGLRSYPQLDDLIKLTVFLCKKKKIVKKRYYDNFPIIEAFEMIIEVFNVEISQFIFRPNLVISKDSNYFGFGYL